MLGPEEEQEEQQQPELGHRGRRLRYTDYEKDREFASEEEAKKFVKAEEMWRLRQARETTEGKKTCYDCKFDRKCRARLVGDWLEKTSEIIFGFISVF